MGPSGIQAQKAPRFLCHECPKTCRATTGTAVYRLRPAAATVRRVGTLLAPGGPVQALGVAFGFDARTVAAWWARSGRQGQAGQASLVEYPRALGQGQADELRIKQQGGLVWRALAMRVQTRVWWGGEVRAQRDLPLLRRLVARVKRCAARRPLVVCTAGVVSSIRAMRETLCAPV